LGMNRTVDDSWVYIRSRDVEDRARIANEGRRSWGRWRRGKRRMSRSLGSTDGRVAVACDAPVVPDQRKGQERTLPLALHVADLLPRRQPVLQVAQLLQITPVSPGSGDHPHRLVLE
jgi:hypothetical protein